MHTNPFATEAAEYAHLRPTYPDDLFAFLSTVVASRHLPSLNGSFFCMWYEDKKDLKR
jgi:hypothetical protein